ncbi:hypothetical protein OUZ56_031082 [Daphnia magna]|uniref:Uncharacterized protein n=1 Tax=Daphnia magna TaxID=35525 RepID=A0ABQ9ZTC3_9CRUS|nr:hypothetical protein OUZ56_031082 [Daphnia magna]
MSIESGFFVKKFTIAFCMWWCFALSAMPAAEQTACIPAINSFFAVRCINRNDVHFLDVIPHKTLMPYSYLEVISTFKGKSEEDQTHEVFRFVRQLTIQHRIQ